MNVYVPGLPVNLTQNLPVANTMLILLPNRTPVSDNTTNAIIKPYTQKGVH